jgi:hypothetical protein
MSTFHLRKPRCRVLSAAVSIAFVAWLVTAAPALAQGEPKYLGGSKVENAREMRELKDKLRDGSALDAESREFVRQTVLPQLTLEENASTIERTRRRMREVLLTEIEDEKAFADMSRLVADFMTALARDGDAEPAVQVNAMLLVGEMRGKDGKLWPPVRPTLAAAAGDAQLPIAVRIAAIAGLGRHVEACRGDAEATAALAKAAGPAIMAILAEPVVSDRRAEQEWLASRAVSLLPALVPTAAKNVAAVLAAIVEDPARATDMRVRAAAALGATANAKSEINAAKLIDTIRGIALQSLEADVAAADVRRFERQYRSLAAGQQAAMQPGNAPAGESDPAANTGLAIPEQACRRNAWRLVTLADAIDSEDGGPGLAALLGQAAAPAKQLAATLRDAGLAIDQTPDEESVVAAIKAIKTPAQAPAQAPAGAPVPAQPAAAPQAQAEEPAEQPAGAPNASPFD